MNNETYVMLGNLPDKLGYAVPSGGYKKSHPMGKNTQGQQGYDDSIEDTAIRNLIEDTGFKPPHSPVFVGNPVSLYGLSNDAGLHTTQHYFLWHLGNVQELPQPQQDGHFSNATWVKASDIVVAPGKVKDSVAQCGAVGDLAGLHAEKLDEALTVLRDKQLEAIGTPMATLKHYAQTASEMAGVHNYKQMLEAQPAHQYGQEGQFFNKGLMLMAYQISEEVGATAVISRQRSQKLAQEGFGGGMGSIQ